MVNQELNTMAIRETPVPPFDYGNIAGLYYMLATYKDVAENLGRSMSSASLSEFTMLQDWFKDKGVIPVPENRRKDKKIGANYKECLDKYLQDQQSRGRTESYEKLAEEFMARDLTTG
jgi:hypothetical protein